MFINNNSFPSCLALEYQHDALHNHFRSVAHLPWAMLLSSGHATHPHSRYDILVAEPLATLCTTGEHTCITQGEVQTTHQDDPLALLAQTQAALLPNLPAHPTLPFLGGALGLFGYDLGRRFEQLPEHAVSDISVPDMAVGIYDWALIADHQQQTLTLLSHGDIYARWHWLLAAQESYADRAAEEMPFTLTSEWQANMSAEEYRQKFDQVQAYLHAGDCYQVNLAQRFSADYQGSEWQAFERLNASNQAPFSAFLRLPQGSILSVSPERFLAVEQQQVTTRPIKGTRPRHSDPISDRAEAAALTMSEKDRAENLMIVDLMRNDIGRVAVPGSVSVPELFIVESFPAVHHLVSTVQASLPDTCSNTDLLRACFPGGSITGAPKIRSMQIIDELEPQRRNAYCGSIGYLSCCGRMDTSITIRTLIAAQGRLHCWAGGGLVADSQWESEYQETRDKVAKILPILSATPCEPSESSAIAMASEAQDEPQTAHASAPQDSTCTLHGDNSGDESCHDAHTEPQQPA
ncbi:aminodeoxychorismate synthase component 1 [Plesiomonas shigelloides]|uniref:aminodeoxychorismate synthase component 1 n=1 Tax=Plesiomonas shigelloides TaxID=703 RepID=UPI00242E380E|nr:aminodeoxychorismate synthase component 1 [Plesiomonas shigelloides]